MKLKPFSALLISFRTYYTIPLFTNPKQPRTSVKVERTKWTDQQLQILEAVENGQSVFVTGSAGTGKTHLIKEIISVLRKIHGRGGVFVTASTGVAACALNGQTLHSFAGVGLGEAKCESLLSRVLSDKRALTRWKNAKALIIDEISMVDGELFDKLEYVARGVMASGVDVSQPELFWGGKQIVVSGDFFQLPPVGVEKKKGGKKFAFEAHCWDNSFQLQVSLNSVFRQSDDEYVRILEGIRKGKLESEDEKLLERCCCSNEDEWDKTTVRLFPRNEDVDRVNGMRLQELGEEIVGYEAFDTGKERRKSQLNQGVSPVTLKLCKGARVMLIKNMNVKHKLVNGATGIVTGFFNVRKGNVQKICRYDGGMVLPMVKFDSGVEMLIKPAKWEVMEGDKILGSRLQLPLVLAWATSIHKSQGMTLDKLYANLSKSFGYGMVYVAFSRVRCLDGLYLSGFKPSLVKAHPKVLAFYEKFFEQDERFG